MRRLAGLLLVLGVAGFGALALAQGSGDDGLIGPANKIQPSGRKLAPAGKLTRVGNHPGGGALTPNGRFLLDPVGGTRAQRRAHRARGPAQAVQEAGARRQRAAQARLQAVREEGAPFVAAWYRCFRCRGSAAASPLRATAVPRTSLGSPSRRTRTSRRPAGTPGKEGDVIHVLTLRPASTGRATPGGHDRGAAARRRAARRRASRRPRRAQVLAARPRRVAATGRRCSPRSTWPIRAAIIDTETQQVALREGGSYPYGAAITRDGKYGPRLERVRRARCR